MLWMRAVRFAASIVAGGEALYSGQTLAGDAATQQGVAPEPPPRRSHHSTNVVRRPGDVER